MAFWDSVQKGEGLRVAFLREVLGFGAEHPTDSTTTTTDLKAQQRLQEGQAMLAAQERANRGFIGGRMIGG